MNDEIKKFLQDEIKKAKEERRELVRSKLPTGYFDGYINAYEKLLKNIQ